MLKVNLEQAERNLLKLIARAVHGEEILIEVDDEHLVKLSAVEEAQGQRPFGYFKDDLVFMAEDFDAPLNDFAEYM